MTTKELLEAEKIVAEREPLFLVEKEFLKIKTKAGDIRTLKLNQAQRIVLGRIKARLREGRPVRLWLLKARQMGCSTLIEAIVYAFTSQGEGINSAVISHDLGSSNYLFEMQKLYHEKLDEHLKPKIKHSNEKKLEFEGTHSQILIDTADKADKAGRSFTLRMVHLSEVSRYPNLKQLLTGLNQAVPFLPGTMIIGETTAKGIGNQFYDEWMECSDAGKVSDWETLFIPWFSMDEYKLPLTNGFYPIDAIKFVNATEREKFLIGEKKLKAKYGLTDEQINWRRWCIVNNCNRSILEFNQEYPDSPATAFISTGDLFFNRDALGEQEIKEPLAVGNIVKEGGKYTFRTDATGLFKIYELPGSLEQYALGADSAEGLEHGDKSAAVILNKRTNRTACTYNHNIAPDRFAEDLIKMGNYYNQALIACENNGYGYGVNQDLYRNYGRIYRKVRKKSGFTEPTLELGWNTNSSTRPQMIAQLAEEIFNESTELKDKDLIRQCWTFINNPKKRRAEAEPGKCDDMVLARAIAGQVRIDEPYKERGFKKKKRKRFKGLAGY